MMNEKIKKLLSNAKDTVLETTMQTSQIEVISNNCAVVQGADRVLEYDVNIIRISVASKGAIGAMSSTSAKEIQFWGNNFSIEYLNGDCIEIRGEISKIEFV